jgi:exodeoxyribonuclease VII small subunit
MTTKKATDITKLTFEQSLAELEDIVSTLESGEANLDKAMEIYTRGQLLKEHCSQKLSMARLQVEQISAGSGGNIGLEPFNPEA